MIVITGASGTVGAALVPHLVEAYPEREFVLLTRSPQRLSIPGATTLRCDISRDDLSLPADLRERVTLIVHSAADTRFNLPLEDARRVNTEGTRRVLEFAGACPRLEQFAHISTLYIAGKRPGPVLEAPLDHDCGYVNTYEQSKHEAEELVLAASQRFPIAIYRLSSIVDTGAGRGHVRQFLRLLPWSAQFPAIPGLPEVPVDLVTDQWTARTLGILIAEHFALGAIRHVCAGEQRSPSVGELLELAFDAYEEAIGRPAPRPALVRPSEFETVARSARGAETLLTFLPHLSIPQPFDPGFAARIGLEAPDIRPVISQVIAEEFAPAELVS